MRAWMLAAALGAFGGVASAQDGAGMAWTTAPGRLALVDASGQPAVIFACDAAQGLTVAAPAFAADGAVSRITVTTDTGGGFSVPVTMMGATGRLGAVPEGWNWEAPFASASVVSVFAPGMAGGPMAAAVPPEFGALIAGCA